MLGIPKPAPRGLYWMQFVFLLQSVKSSNLVAMMGLHHFVYPRAFSRGVAVNRDILLPGHTRIVSDDAYGASMAALISSVDGLPGLFRPPRFFV
jgi:hypothetical protein